MDETLEQSEPPGNPAFMMPSSGSPYRATYKIQGKPISTMPPADHPYWIGVDRPVPATFPPLPSLSRINRAHGGGQ